ncbi:SMP-30/gluconolactonase/LRE family protein [Acidovorax sp. SUPP2539]|uniref:SMP-30/gluconolactonase/LRE family protein n=1 Tax=Acidovorax sp. SUPP2539 TaxID=2920878 RepID=UPI0023DE24DB|nr:SMP-30/gluconolactonase/LRE family protein [Acidovorax sp. SUPP2539]GKS89743.1 SMP-30/gluconolactonase/LRE family protein [Acidovorax sp. SUPP2539]
MDLRIDILAPQRDLLGECPLWDARTQSLYWIDGRAGIVRRHTPATGAGVQWQLPQHIGAIALCDSGRLLLALEDDFQYLDPDTGTLSPLGVRVAHGADRMRLNDGRTDRNGRFVVGSMTLGRMAPEGALYQLGAHAVRTLDTGIHVANGTCFSPDGRWLYFADSPTHQVRRYAYDAATGDIGPAEVMVDTRALGSVPDGATVDAEGCLWVALVQNGQLARFTPDGRLERRIQLPVTFVTCPCFGGPGLDVIYLTSIRDSGNLLRSDHPDAGAVFAIHGTGVRGLEEARFADLPSHHSTRTPQ